MRLSEKNGINTHIIGTIHLFVRAYEFITASNRLNEEICSRLQEPIRNGLGYHRQYNTYCGEVLLQRLTKRFWIRIHVNVQVVFL